MAKKDYISGVFRSGIFNAYGLIGDYQVKKFETGSNEEARTLANAQGEVHGTYKDGVFRPANVRGEKGFANTIDLNKKRYFIDHRGQLYDQRGAIAGLVDGDGKFQSIETNDNSKSYREKLDNRRENISYKSEVDYGGHRERIFEIEGGGIFTGKQNKELSDLAEYLIRSHRVLGKFRTYDKTGTSRDKKIRVYEGEIPEYDPQTKAGSGWNGESKDGSEHVILINRGLSHDEQIATLTHELSHVYGQKDPYVRGRELRIEEHDTHLAAIDHLVTLYQDYDALKKATEGREKSYFNVTDLSKEDIGKAVARLVSTKGLFEINNEELSQHDSTFKRIVKDLESRVGLYIAAPSLIASILLSSKKITGNFILNNPLQKGSIYFLSACFFLIGIFGIFMYSKKRRFMYREFKELLN